MSGTFFSSRNTGANEEQALGLELLGSADGIGIVRVSTIDDNVTSLKMGFKLLDEVVNGLASLDEKNNFAGTLQLGNKLLNRVSPLDVGTCRTDADKT